MTARIRLSGIQTLFGRSRNSTSKSKDLQKCKFSNESQQAFVTQNAVRIESRKPPKIQNKSSTQPPLSQPLPGVPAPVYAPLTDERYETQVTTLSNGLRVASEKRFGQFCTVGVVIDSGCRYEIDYPSGITHFLEKLAFNSTTVFQNKDRILYELEKHGGICDCRSFRDIFIYAVSALTSGLDPVMRVLAETVFRPLILKEEFDISRKLIQFELETMTMKPEQENILTDMLYAAAYGDNTVGLPKICPADNVMKIDRTDLFTFLKSYHTPSRMVVVGVGVEHEALVEIVQKYFVELKPIWEQDTGLVLLNPTPTVDHSVAQYTGGMVQEQCEIPVHMGSSGLPELAHIMIGLECVSHQDPDFISTCVLNMMMGGGGSFSAGGPGKGMYTRLYTNVLSRYHWMFSATAYHYAYIDTGLFRIHASAPPQYTTDMTEAIVQELVAMSKSIEEAELNRAKTQLQSLVMMSLEACPVVFEHIGRHVLVTGHRKRPSYFMKAISSVTKDDIVRVVTQMLKSPPAVAVRGNINKMPSLINVQAGLAHPEGKMPHG